jgi:hypothetical protein
MKLALCGLFLFAQIAHASLEKYSSLVVADNDAKAPVPANAVRVTYLGVNGYQFETDGHALLVDPYFTRTGFWSAALNQRIESNPERVNEGLKNLRPRADAILVTHAHFDDLLDVPEIMRKTGARLLSGSTAVNLVQALDLPQEKYEIVKPGSVQTIGPWTIRVFAAQHDRLFGKVPFERCTRASNRPSPPVSAALRRGRQSSPSGRGGHIVPGEGGIPVKASDWCVGEPLAFVIEAGGKRICIDSGGVPGGAAGPAS